MVDNDKELIYAFDSEWSSNIVSVEIKNISMHNDLSTSPKEIVASPPENEKFYITHPHSMVYVYNCIILLLFHSRKCYDIWALDLRNKTWYKNKFQLPSVVYCNVIDVKDNLIYFINHGTDLVGYNFKISLFDLIPSEVLNRSDEQDYILIHRFMRNITGGELLCPDSLINVIVLFYPPLLYA